MSRSFESAIVHSAAEIAALLQLGLTPITDNAEALAQLGFERAYPHLDAGYESTVWERSSPQARRSSGERVTARERAFLKGRHNR